MSPVSPAVVGGFFITEAPGKPFELLQCSVRHSTLQFNITSLETLLTFFVVVVVVPHGNSLFKIS